MSLNIASVTSLVINLLDKNNTTTSSFDVSSSLAVRVQIVGIGEPEVIPIPSTQYPAILVNAESQSEDWSQLGATARRLVTINFQVVPITYAGLGQMGESARENSYIELYQLTSNIENVFRNKPDLSGTSLGITMVRVSDVKYGKIRGENYYCQTAIINLEVQLLTT
jgi:hypothetical protein